MDNDDILYEAEEFAEMHPALDMAQDTLSVTVLVGTKARGLVPYLLTSAKDGTVHAVDYNRWVPDGQALKTQGLDLTAATPRLRWTGEGLRKALSGEAFEVPTFGEAYHAVRNKLAEYLVVSDERHLTVAALFTMLTYFHPLFDKLPILWCYANQSNGKSRLATAVGLLSFNGMVSGTSTRSTIFRQADEGRYTQVLTEMDVLAGTKTGDALATDFHGCTDPAEAWVTVSEQGKSKDYKPARYYGYSPRVLCTTVPIKSTPLLSRCIRLVFEPTANADYDKLDKTLRPENIDFAPVRDLMYRLQLGRWPEVRAGYAAAKQSWRGADAPRSRTRDKWMPLYTLAVLSGDEDAVATVKQLAASDPYTTEKSRANTPDAYLLIFAGWLVAQTSVHVTATSRELWEAFTNPVSVPEGAPRNDAAAWADAVGLNLDVSWLKRGSAGGANKLTSELEERLKLCTYKRTTSARYYVFDKDTVLRKVEASLGREAVIDCLQAVPSYRGKQHTGEVPQEAYAEVHSSVEAEEALRRAGKPTASQRRFLHNLGWEEAAIDAMDKKRWKGILDRREWAPGVVHEEEEPTGTDDWPF